MKAPRIILMFVIMLFVNSGHSQIKNRKVLDGFAIKIGMEWSSFSNYNSHYTELFEDIGDFISSVSYNYSKKMSFELGYRYQSDFGYGRNFYLSQVLDSNGFVLISDYYSNYDRVYSNVFDFKANYSVLNPLKNLQIYLIGAISVAVQRVKNFDFRMYLAWNEKVHYYQGYDYNTELKSYNRFLIGPKAGIGVSYLFGKFGINAESAVSVKYSPFIDKNYRERSITLSVTPFYKF